MRFLHLADLHLGKSLHGISLMENGDQPAWVVRFLALAGELRPEAVVMAGDIYDRSAPAGDAVQLLDRLLTGLSRLGIPVMLIAGNHDSGQRLSFAGELLSRQDVHIAGTLSPDGSLRRVTLRDEYGPVSFWLMPYVFPALVSQVLGDDTIRDYDAAVRALLSVQEIDRTQRNVIVAHQNVTANGVEAVRGGSETMVGGVGQVDYTAFDGFCYAALGHIHAGYPVGRETVRYAGSPLCYHFEETKQRGKGPVLVTLGADGACCAETLRIEPLHPMRELRGEYAALRDAELASARRGEYIRIVLTDRRVTPEVSQFFRDLYEGRGSVLMELVSEFDPFTGRPETPTGQAAGEKTVEELFADFYTERCNQPPTAAEADLLRFAAELQRSADDPAKPGEALIERLVRFALGQEVEG